MSTTSGGWTSHTIRGDGDYEARKRAAIAQSKMLTNENAFMQGVSSGTRKVGDSIKDTRSVYGNVNTMPEDLLQGPGFSQADNPGNKAMNAPMHQTGSFSLMESQTQMPQQDPEVNATQAFETSQLDARLRNMAKGGMNNLNNISALYGRG